MSFFFFNLGMDGCTISYLPVAGYLSFFTFFGVSVDMFLFCLQGSGCCSLTSTADDDPWWSVLSSACKKMLVSRVQFISVWEFINLHLMK